VQSFLIPGSTLWWCGRAAPKLARITALVLLEGAR
jgi:hypothetical protein